MIKSNRLFSCRVFTLLLVFSLAMVPFIQGQSAEIRNDIYSEFSTQTLSSHQLDAFQQRAEQLIYELVDYHNLLRDPQLDEELRTILIGEIQQLFHRQDVKIALPGSTSLAGLQAFDFTKAPALEIQSLSKLADVKQEEGRIWKYKVHLSSGRGEVNVMASTILRKQLKNFGSSQKTVWDVVLLGWELE